tara:strand:- start:302 stop:613 length:312 start_codon:yes stop_codon:yes gene_type:complete
MVQPGETQVDNQQLVVDLVGLVVEQIMVVQYNHQQEITFHLLMQLQTLLIMDGVIQAVQELHRVIVEVAVVLEVAVVPQQLLQEVRVEWVCNFPQHLEIQYQQ